jgi:hypothetical protein
LLRTGSVPLPADRYRRWYVALGDAASARTFDTPSPMTRSTVCRPLASWKSSENGRDALAFT